MTAEFDKIADIYDDTRPPLNEAELGTLEDVLKKHNCHSILEVGVGTGRVSKPLSELSFDVVGVDLSTGMISRAKQKGLRKLVIADTHWLPFIDDAFDGAILVHIVHLLADPMKALAEIARVVKRNVMAIVRNPASPVGEYEQARRIVRERVAHNSQYRSLEDRWKKEAELLQIVPPIERRQFCDRTTEITVEEMISRLKKRAYRFTVDISEEELDKIAGDIASLIKGKTISRRRIEDIAIWQAGQLKCVRETRP